MKYLLIVLLSFFLSAQALADRALKESSRCSMYFAHYEHMYQMPKNLLRAVSVTESGRWHDASRKKVAWPWVINVKGKGYYFENELQAIAAVSKLQSKGVKSIDVGCMQINLKYHPDAFENLHQAFNPEHNIGYAARYIHQQYKYRKDWQQAIARYHNKNPSLGGRYVKRVFQHWKGEDRAFDVASLDVQKMPVIRVKSSDMHVSDALMELTRRSMVMFD